MISFSRFCFAAKAHITRKVSNLLTYEFASTGLFQQAISQSGSPICPWGFHTPGQAAFAAYAFGVHMNISADTNEQLLDALKKADIEDTIKAVNAMINDLKMV